MSQSKHKVVFLDWFKSLSFSRYWEHLEVGSHKDRELYGKLEKALFSSPLIELMNPWIIGKYTTEQMCEKVAIHSGIHYKIVFKNFIKACEIMEFCDSQVPNLLRAIRQKGSHIIIATDNMDSFDRWVYPSINSRYPDCFDGFLNSSNIGSRKENFKSGKSLFFKDYMRTNSLKYQDCILLDDHADKDDQFKTLGLDYIQITSSEVFVKSLKQLAT